MKPPVIIDITDYRDPTLEKSFGRLTRRDRAETDIPVITQHNQSHGDLYNTTHWNLLFTLKRPGESCPSSPSSTYCHGGSSISGTTPTLSGESQTVCHYRLFTIDSKDRLCSPGMKEET